MAYYIIKIIHVVSAAVLFGVGISSFFFSWLMQKAPRDIKLRFNQLLMYSDWCFVGTAGLLQPITGFLLLGVKHYALTPLWWCMTLVGYGLAGLLWFPAIYLQEKGYYRWRFVLCSMAFVILLVVLYAMTNIRH